MTRRILTQRPDDCLLDFRPPLPLWGENKQTWRDIRMDQELPQNAPNKLKELRREFNALFETLFRVLKEIDKAEKKEAPAKNSSETAQKSQD